MYKILLVEDDRNLACEIIRQIESYGNECRVITDFRKVDEEFLAYLPHLVLMDIVLPFRDGYYWAGELRRQSAVPIVFLSSASDGMSIVMAINMGGDDFISKPVAPMVLNAKLQAILRRAYEMPENVNMLSFCGARLNLADGTVCFENKQADLTKNEFRILQMLVENRGKIVSRDALMMKLWNDNCFVEENTLTVNVTRLRKKLEEIGLVGVILTKQGSGYLIQ